MTSPLTVRGPGGFVPAVAIAFGTQDGPATAVDGANPLPTRGLLVASGVPPLSGNVNAPIAEESVAGATYYLAVTLTSGTLAYRVEQ